MNKGLFARPVLIGTLTCVLFVFHLWYAWAGGSYLYEESGGITHQGLWTHYGGAAFAWTLPIELPATMVAVIGQSIFGFHNPPFGGLRILSLFLLLAGSLATAFGLAVLLVTGVAREQLSFRKHWWIYGLVILGVFWIPVPEWLAEVYQFTVIY